MDINISLFHLVSFLSLDETLPPFPRNGLRSVQLLESAVQTLEKEFESCEGVQIETAGVGKEQDEGKKNGFLDKQNLF